MNDTRISDSLLSLEEVAFRLCISHWGLRRRMQKRGAYGARKVGRRWWFDQSVFSSPLALAG
jgi:hypothetical protein